MRLPAAQITSCRDAARENRGPVYRPALSRGEEKENIHRDESQVVGPG